jgi:hypothetical protein
MHDVARLPIFIVNVKPIATEVIRKKALLDAGRGVVRMHRRLFAQKEEKWQAGEKVEPVTI